MRGSGGRREAPHASGHVYDDRGRAIADHTADAHDGRRDAGKGCVRLLTPPPSSRRRGATATSHARTRGRQQSGAEKGHERAAPGAETITHKVGEPGKGGSAVDTLQRLVADVDPSSSPECLPVRLDHAVWPVQQGAERLPCVRARGQRHDC
eukprot:6180819-Pleurochrysis_carterae.AAC.2